MGVAADYSIAFQVLAHTSPVGGEKKPQAILMRPEMSPVMLEIEKSPYLIDLGHQFAYLWLSFYGCTHDSKTFLLNPTEVADLKIPDKIPPEGRQKFGRYMWFTPIQQVCSLTRITSISCTSLQDSSDRYEPYCESLHQPMVTEPGNMSSDGFCTDDFADNQTNGPIPSHGMIFASKINDTLMGFPVQPEYTYGGANFTYTFYPGGHCIEREFVEGRYFCKYIYRPNAPVAEFGQWRIEGDKSPLFIPHSQEHVLRWYRMMLEQLEPIGNKAEFILTAEMVFFQLTSIRYKRCVFAAQNTHQGKTTYVQVLYSGTSKTENVAILNFSGFELEMEDPPFSL